MGTNIVLVVYLYSAASSSLMSRLSYAVVATLAFGVGLTTAVSTARATGPTVQLDNATFVGATVGSVSRFLGIPFAQPPWVPSAFEVITHRHVAIRNQNWGLAISLTGANGAIYGNSERDGIWSCMPTTENYSSCHQRFGSNFHRLHRERSLECHYTLE